MSQGLYTDPEIETPSICELKRQLTVDNPIFANEKIVHHENLIPYADFFGIATDNKSDEQLADEIILAAPCNWINNVLEWARHDKPASDALNVYVTDTMMHILSNIREGVALTRKETSLMREVNEAVLRSPRPTHGFNIYRGSHYPETVGQINTMDTPKSGSFYFPGVLEGYINLDDQTGEICCVYEIYIPTGSIVSYHPSEDQIIFPIAAQFYTLAGPLRKKYRVFGKEEEVTVYQQVYIGVSAPMENRQRDSIYNRLSIIDSYVLAILRDLPFPYGPDPDVILATADESNPSYLQRVYMGRVQHVPSEIRLYLSAKGLDVSSISNYNFEQMVEVLRQNGLI